MAVPASSRLNRCMGNVRFGLALLISLFTVLWSRLRRGPLLPSWSFGFELITRAQKRFHAAIGRLPPLEQRRLWGDLQAKSGALLEVTQREELIDGVRVIWFEPRSKATRRVVLYLHGGSFIYGSETSHGDLAARIALAGAARVALPLYRLAPEHPFPAALEDAVCVYRTLAVREGAAHLAVAGDSAGGNLTLALLLRLREHQALLPGAAVVIGPWVDLTAQGGSLERNQPYDWAEPEMFELWARTYLAQGEDRRSPEISPAYADLRGLPPLLVLVGSAELLLDQVLSFTDRVRESGVPVTLHVGEDMIHLWIAHAPLFPSCQVGIEAIGQFLAAKLG